LKKNWKELVNDLDRGNATLRQLLGDNDKLASGRARRNVDFPTSWDGIRDRAQNLFDALASSWGCQCSVTHCANLLLGDWVSDARNEGCARRDCDFKLWLSVDVGEPEGMTTRGVLWDWHHVKVKSLSFPSTTKAPNSPSEPEANVNAKDVSVRETESNKGSFPKLKSLLPKR
jgi:hypothetical protein